MPVALVLVLAVLVTACAAPPVDEGPPPLRIAVGPDPEAALLARTAGVLAGDADVPVELLELADVRSERQAVELGDADLYVGYSGQAWLEVLGRADPPADPTAGLAVVAAADRARDLVWLVPGGGVGLEEPPANATFALFVAGPRPSTPTCARCRAWRCASASAPTRRSASTRGSRPGRTDSGRCSPRTACAGIAPSSRPTPSGRWPASSPATASRG